MTLEQLKAFVLINDFEKSIAAASSVFQDIQIMRRKQRDKDKFICRLNEDFSCMPYFGEGPSPSLALRKAIADALRFETERSL